MTRAPLGVNLAGYFQSVMGIGEVVRSVAAALESQGVEVTPVPLAAGHLDELSGAGPGATTVAQRHPINLICVNAEGLDVFADRMGPDFFSGRHSIGLWWWEVSDFPDRWLGAFRHLDEVWAGSGHVAAALSAVSPVPVVKVTTPVEPPSPEPLPRAQLGLPEGFLFLSAFDYNSGFERKNPLGALTAFERAFEPGEGPSLALKCIGQEHHPDRHSELVAAAARRPDVHLIDRALEPAERDALLAACDCYLSLHRAEGFGLPLAEAMALGKPAVATGYSGNLEFMTARNSWLVDYTLVPIGAGAEPYPAGGTWAEPDLDDAVRALREVAGDPDAAGRRAARGRADLLRGHSREAAGADMARRLARVHDRWGERAAGERRADGAAGAARRIAAGAEASAAPTSAPRGALRRLMLRALKPYTTFQRGVDQELVRSIDELRADVEALRAGQDRLAEQVRRDAAASTPRPDR